ncbi:MAG: UDP-N-acetylmuramate--L-alanine ligase [Defluviitaleaceae bacterium]|nr:UDP-N-acetylmuramate--L-alanine ligase [Defluviitaleaceae bacterium]
MRKKIDLNGAKKVHFIGIGGISISGLAEILHRDGFEVSGSDAVDSEKTKELRRLGIKIFVPNAAENIAEDIDLIVYTAAVKPDNPEFSAAVSRGIRRIERAAFLAMLLEGYDAICVAGSHGKTTTTSLVAEIALAARLDPTINIGGHMNLGGSNYRVGDSKTFVLESCEYSNQFSHWHPHIGVILNVDADHLDFYGNMDNLIAAFAVFAQNIRPEGALVISKDAQGFDEITRKASCKIVTFGLSSDADFRAENIIYNEGRPSFDVFFGSEFKARVDLPLPGEYNMLNALAAFAAASRLNIPPETTARALSEARGTQRRFEYKGSLNGAKIIDDYAHHPTEIRACLAAARKAATGRVICLFQPHTYTRTKNLLDDFAQSFSDADEIVLLPIFAAREPFDPEISSEMLAERIKFEGNDVKFAQNFLEAGNYLTKVLRQNDLLVTMGAGDVYEVGENMIASKLSTLSTEPDE